MINLLGRQLNSFTTALLALIAVVLLQGCGAERTTPFSPSLSSSSCSSSSSSNSSSSSSLSSSSSSSSCSSTSSSSISSSSSSSAISVAVTALWSATNTTTTIEKKEKNVQIIRTTTDFDTAAMAYIGRTLNEDLGVGQVILVDDGEVDSCTAHLEFNKTISAVQLTDNTVRVTLSYVERPKQDNCTPSISRPFAFYYLLTTKLLVTEEKILQ